LSKDRTLRCTAILFDLDGVLVDSAECIERTWRGWAARHRLDPERVISAAHGRRTRETIQLVAPELAADAEVASLEANEAMTAEGVHEIEGARELLAGLPRDSWAIVTSGIRAVAEFRISLMGLPSPKVMICADDIERGKPDPEGYLAAAAGLGKTPGQCIVIEDAPAGVEAARNAGMRVIAVIGTYPLEMLTPADAIVKRLKDLTVRRERAQILIDVGSDSARREGTTG
jgi:sugar-phosphatase